MQGEVGGREVHVMMRVGGQLPPHTCTPTGHHPERPRKLTAQTELRNTVVNSGKNGAPAAAEIMPKKMP